MILILFVITAAGAMAQVASSTLAGTVRDQSSALVSGATITARHEPTGFTRTILSSDEGEYSIDRLAPGSYTITVDKRGFRTVTAASATLAVNQKGRLDFELQPGPAADTITVTATISPVEADDASIGYSVNYGAAVRLPLIDRNLISLVTLGPGAIPRHLGGFTHDVVNDIQPSRGAVMLNPPIHGARSTMNAFVLDGASNTRPACICNGSPPAARIRSGLPNRVGVGIRGVSPSRRRRCRPCHQIGRTQLSRQRFRVFPQRGDGCEKLLRRSAAAASDFPAQPVFGGSLGGPLPFPRSFFFATYEGVRGKSAKSSLNLVPNSELRGGKFTGRDPIFDPLSRDSSGSRAPFPNNVIPSNRIDSIARRFLDQFQPLPNRSAGGTANYLDATPSDMTNDSGSIRVDHELSASHRIFGRYTINNEQAHIAGVFPLLPTMQNLRAQQAVVGMTTAGGHWSNELRGSFTRLRVFSIPQSAFTRDIARELGVGGVSTDPFTFGLPYFAVTNFNLTTDDPILPQAQRNNLLHVADAVSIVRGGHTLKFAGE